MGLKRRIIRNNGLYFLCGGLMCPGPVLMFAFPIQHNPTCREIYPEPPASAPSPECELPYCLTDLGYPLSLITKPKIYVLKADRRLWLVQDKTLVRDYHIALGPSPRGDKFFRGNGRTPEGNFFVARRMLPATITNRWASAIPIRITRKAPFPAA